MMLYDSATFNEAAESYALILFGEKSCVGVAEPQEAEMHAGLSSWQKLLVCHDTVPPIYNFHYMEADERFTFGNHHVHAQEVRPPLRSACNQEGAVGHAIAAHRLLGAKRDVEMKLVYRRHESVVHRICSR